MGSIKRTDPERLKTEGVNYLGYGTIPQLAMRDWNINVKSKAIYAYLCALSGSEKVTYPTCETICTHLGMNKDTYYTHRKALIEDGYIAVSDLSTKQGKHFTSTVFTLLPKPKCFDERFKEQIHEDQSKWKDSVQSLIISEGILAAGYGLIPRSVFFDERLTATSKALYAYIASFAGAGKTAFPSKKITLNDLGLSSPTYNKALKELLLLGYLKRTQRRVNGNYNVVDFVLSLYPTIHTEEELKNPVATHEKSSTVKRRKLPKDSAAQPKRFPNETDSETMNASRERISDTIDPQSEKNPETIKPETIFSDTIYTHLSTSKLSEIGENLENKETISSVFKSSPKNNMSEKISPCENNSETISSEAEKSETINSETSINSLPSINRPSSIINPSINRPEIDRYDFTEDFGSIDFMIPSFTPQQCLQLIKESLAYDDILTVYPNANMKLVDGLIQMMANACSLKTYVAIGKDTVPVDDVRHVFFNYTAEYLFYVIDALSTVTSRIRNIRAYCLTSLYHAPETFEAYYDNMVSTDDVSPGRGSSL